MDQDQLKTSPKQRILIAVIAFVMIGSIIASYAAIILGNSSSTSSSSNSAIVAKYEEGYSEAIQTLTAASQEYFDEFIQYKSRIVAYNETSANSNGVTVEDLKEGTGRELTEDDSDYLAYYVGWCADETIFDSTFNSTTNPTAFNAILDASLGLIEGWNLGVEGMKLGGIREMTIPGELAYADTQEICGGYNKPLKFIVMALDANSELGDIAAEYTLAQTKYQYAQYGIDYDDLFGTSEDYEEDE